MKPDFIQTRTGKKFYFDVPKVRDIAIDDIAHALSNICRFNGHTHSFYSVAEHSYYTSLLVPEEHALAALLHDATEAYVGDMVRPLKARLPQYKDFEKEVEQLIMDKFMVNTRTEQIKKADNEILKREAKFFFNVSGLELDTEWGLEGIHEADVTIECWSQEMVKMMFLSRFHELTKDTRSRT